MNIRIQLQFHWKGFMDFWSCINSYVEMSIFSSLLLPFIFFPFFNSGTTSRVLSSILDLSIEKCIKCKDLAKSRIRTIFILYFSYTVNKYLTYLHVSFRLDWSTWINFLGLDVLEWMVISNRQTALTTHRKQQLVQNKKHVQ